ncbi:hypothetical protein M9Q43_06200 [Flavobacterium sp. HXWNR29]|uniref:hypothetical protein n=1 Tax=Flavobacterium odoriferum TaxID=2946604 RepID=UPI0021CB07A5|nr:hypothetical protein [Flavobacterium sp. HXWNR29]MCU4188756.1 hypothetical protein [Flavobacterium sp. HXWNR29]
MKKNLFPILCLLLTLSSFAQMNGLQNTSKKHELNGKVKTMSYHITPKNEVPSEANMSWKYFFDEKGRLTHTYFKNQHFGQDVYSYGSNDSIAKYEKFDKSNKKVREVQFYFNDKNLRDKEVHFEADTLEMTYKLQYNNKNQKIEMIKYLKDTIFLLKYVYEYNSNGLLTKTSLFDRKNKLQTITTYKYNSKGRCIESRENDFEDIDTKYLYTYDANGMQNSFLVLGKDNKMIMRNDYVFDANGNVTRETSKISEINFQSVTNNTHVYDSQKNWIIKTNSSKTGTKIVKRVIEYY